MIDSLIDLGTTVHVEVCRQLLYEDQTRLGQEGPGNRQAEPLTQGKLHATVVVTYQGIQSVFQLEHKLCIGEFESCLDLDDVYFAATKLEIVED